MRQAPLTVVLAVVLAFGQGGSAVSQAGGSKSLAQDQARIRERVAGVEQRLLEMARLLEAERPEKAEQLRNALTVSRERFIVSRMENVRGLLDSGRYSEAARVQAKLVEDLGALAEALSAEQWAGELERLRDAEHRLAKLRQEQLAAAERTPGLSGAESFRDASEDQRAMRRQAQKLLGELRGGPAAERLYDAVTRMSAAQDALSAEAPEEAAEAQRGAGDHLAAALAAVRGAIARLEAQHRARLRRKVREMLEQVLEAQRAIRKQTELADRHATEADRASRARALRVADLARRQEELAGDLHGALNVLESDRTTVALPAALRHIRADIRTCADLLRARNTGPVVRALQEQVELALAALVEVLRGIQALAATEPAESGMTEMEEPKGRGLVDVLGELRVARMLQATLLQRTASADRLAGADDRQRPSPGEEVNVLADRQAGISAMFDGLGELGVPGFQSAGGPAPAAGASMNAMSREAEALLRMGISGEQTQRLQRGIVGRLDALIALAQAQPAASRTAPGKGRQMPIERPGAATGAPQKPARESILPMVEWQYGRTRDVAEPGEAWLPELPAAELKKITDAFSTGRLPLRYRELLRLYNKRLAEER